MPRNMSFMLTTEPIQARTKTVTRRVGWAFIKPGHIVNACEKCQGLRKGEKIRKLDQIRIISTRWEPLNRITPEDVVTEGFPGMTVAEFVEMFCATHKGCTPGTEVNRIEFEYID